MIGCTHVHHDCAVHPKRLGLDYSHFKSRGLINGVFGRTVERVTTTIYRLSLVKYLDLPASLRFSDGPSFGTFSAHQLRGLPTPSFVYLFITYIVSTQRRAGHLSSQQCTDRGGSSRDALHQSLSEDMAEEACAH